LDALDALQDADATADASRLFGFYDGVFARKRNRLLDPL
jgi:hypothetical protein